MTKFAVKAPPVLSTGTRAAIETITPAIATALIAANPLNRPLSQRAVNKFARDMAAGDWRLNGESVIVTRKGAFIDGLHRMHAVVKSGVAVEMLVVRGVADDVVPTIDTGRSRSYGDVLALRGFGDAVSRRVASAARIWFLYELGTVDGGSITPTASELDLVVDKYGAELVTAAEWISNLPTVRRSCVPSVQTFVAGYGLTITDPGMVKGYLEALDSGTMLTERDAILHLRRRLVEREYYPSGKTQDRNGRARPNTQGYVLGCSIKAFNSYANGREMSRLRFDAATEPFPRLKIG